MKKIIGQLLMHYISYMSTLKEKVDKTDGLDGAGYLSPNNSDTCGHLSGRGITNTTKQKRKKNLQLQLQINETNSNITHKPEILERNHNVKASITYF